MVVATALFGFSCLNATYRLLNWTGNFVYNCSCARTGAAWLATVGSSRSRVRARAHQRSLWVVLGPSSTLRTRHPVTGQDGQTHHHGSSRPLQYHHRWFCPISKREINMVVFNNFIQIKILQNFLDILHLKYNIKWNSKYAAIFYEKSECEDSQISM